MLILLARVLGLTRLSSLTLSPTIRKADNVAPVISLIGLERVWHAVGTTYSDLGATAIDDGQYHVPAIERLVVEARSIEP